MPVDIRTLSDDPVAYAAELNRRWGGLLSYRYIGRKHSSMDAGEEDNTVAIRHDMRNSSGGLLLSVLAIAQPEGGGMNDREAVPNPVIHSCQILDPGHGVRRFEVISEVVKQGRQMGFSRSCIVDADNRERVLAFTEGQGISLGVPPSGLERMEVEPIIVEDSPNLPPLWQVFGVGRREDGYWGLPELSAELASPDAALHIGPQFVLMETVAAELADSLSGGDAMQGISSHVMFAARGKVGPFRAEGSPVLGVNNTVGVQVTIYDEGNENRVITTGSYLFAVR